MASDSVFFSIPSDREVILTNQCKHEMQTYIELDLTFADLREQISLYS